MAKLDPIPHPPYQKLEKKKERQLPTQFAEKSKWKKNYKQMS